MAEAEQDKKLSEVSSKLSRLNGTTEQGLGNVQALTETLVAQSKASLDATETGLASEAEARKEAARARKTKMGATDVNVLNWQKQDGGIFDTLADMLAMKFAWGGLGLVGLGTAVVAAISGALMGAGAGLVAGFLDMWGKIFKFFGGKLAKMFPNVTKTLSDIFGKGGKISQFITSIKAFFTGSKAFQTISNAFLKFKTMLSAFGTRIANFFKPILKLFGGGGASAMGPLSRFGKHFMKFFRIFKTFFAKLFYPLQVIISLVEGFFEAKDAVGKSKGMMATFFNAIIGFFGGILDGLIFGMLDLIKDGISWIAGFLGFEDVEKFLDSFSFSDMFNEFLDGIYEWFNLLFEDPVKALTNLFKKYFGAVLSVGDFIVDMLKKPIIWIMELFGWDDAAAATESFSLTGWVMGIWDKVVGWFKSILSWGKEAGATEEGGWSIMTFIDTIWTNIKDWFKGILSWGKETGATEEGGWSLMTFVSNVWTKIQDWFKNLLTFKGADGKDIGIVDKVIEMFKTMIDDIIAGVKGMIPKRPTWLGGDEDVSKMSPEAIAAEKSKLIADIATEKAKPKAGTGGMFTDERDDEDIANMQARLQNLQQFSEGGLVKQTGVAMLHGTPAAPELVLDNRAASLFMQAAQMLASLQLDGLDLRTENAGGGTQIIQNVTPITTTNNNNSNVGMMPAPSIRVESLNILPGTITHQHPA
tara:strand:+ start:3025 stop:5124 length:2100 start_codon:yes stop_codon:yes gene_type:complete